MLVFEVVTPINSMNSTTPWVGVVANPVKVSSDSHKEADNTKYLATFVLNFNIVKSIKAHYIIY